MNGYIYDTETREIATKIPSIIACNETTIKGDGTAVIGTGQYIITDAEYNEGDILPEGIEDRRAEIPELPVQY
jgi:hypothetical protein